MVSETMSVFGGSEDIHGVATDSNPVLAQLAMLLIRQLKVLALRLSLLVYWFYL